MTFALIAARALGILKSIPWWVFAAIVGILLLWQAWSIHERAVWNKGFNAGWSEQHRALTEEQQSHAITRVSLNQAINSIAEQNDANEKLAAESKSRLAISAQNLEAAKKRAVMVEETAKALDASATTGGPRDAPCVPSDTFFAHSGEL